MPTNEFEQSQFQVYTRSREFPVFPREIFDLIIDFCAQLPDYWEQDERKEWTNSEDPRLETLGSLSLTCHAFGPRSRRYLYPLIRINRAPQTARLVYSLRRSPELGSLTHTLLVHNPIDETLPYIDSPAAFSDNVSINHVLRQITSRLLPNLRSLEISRLNIIFHHSFPILGFSYSTVSQLTLESIFFQTFHDLRRFVSSFSSLSSLNLDRVEWLSEGFPVTRQSLSRFTRTQNISLQQLDIDIDETKIMNVMIWLSSTQTHFSLTGVDLQISSKRAEIQQQLHGTAEVSDFLRKASCLSVLSMEFAYFIHVVDEELINLPWAHLSHLTIDGIRFPDCDKLSSLLYRLEDLGDLSKLSFWFNLENIPFNSASTSSTNAAYYAPWNALDNALSQGPFQRIEHIQMSILIDSQPLFGEDDKIEQREGPRFFPKVYHRINPDRYKLFWFGGE